MCSHFSFLPWGSSSLHWQQEQGEEGVFTSIQKVQESLPNVTLQAIQSHSCKVSSAPSPAHGVLQ